MRTKDIHELLEINHYKPFLAKEELKKCTMCEKTKSTNAFCKNRRYEDYRHPWCIRCTNKINQEREIQKLFARPPWFNQKHEKKLENLRKEVVRLNKMTGIKHSICHKEPIQHCLVCGLDVLENMYIDTQENNAKESNCFLPYRISVDGRIEQIELSKDSIIHAFKFNERFNKKRNEKPQNFHKKCA